MKACGAADRDTGVHVTKTQQFDCVFTPTPVPLLADRVFCNNMHSGAVDAEGRPMIWGGSNLSPTLVRRYACLVCVSTCSAWNAGCVKIAISQKTSEHHTCHRCKQKSL